MIIKKLISIILILMPALLVAQEDAIEKEYTAYVEDFMVFDFDGIASHFTSPAMFIGPSTQVMQDTDSLKNYYHNLQANIQEGYSYSKSDLSVSQVTETIYCLTNNFTRHNDADEILLTATSYNFFRKTNNGWKMFLMEASTLPDL